MTCPGRFLAASLLAALLVTPGALAQSSASSSAVSASASASSVDISANDALLAIALGAGGGGRRSAEDLGALVTLFTDPIKGGDACVVGVRERRGELVESRIRLNDDSRFALTRAILASEGTLTDEALADAFTGRRDKLVLADCAYGATVPSVLFGDCATRGRSCDAALINRLLLDADGITDAERSVAVSALRGR